MIICIKFQVDNLNPYSKCRAVIFVIFNGKQQLPENYDSIFLDTFKTKSESQRIERLLYSMQTYFNIIQINSTVETSTKIMLELQLFTNSLRHILIFEVKQNIMDDGKIDNRIYTNLNKIEVYCVYKLHISMHLVALLIINISKE